jgi:hypothetical protein
MPRIFDLTATTTIADADVSELVDVSNTAQSGDGSTRKVTKLIEKNYYNTHTAQAVTLAAAATTIAVTSQFVTVTGDAGANTVATITGGLTGVPYVFLFVDALVTITDTAAHTANTVDLSTSFTSADDTTLALIYDGTSWYEISRSVN